MKRKAATIFIASVLSISAIALNSDNMSVQAYDSSSTTISTKKLKIKDFKWKTKQVLYMGKRVYTAELTNNSKYDVLGVNIKYRLKENATDQQKALFDDFKKENSDKLDNGEVTLEGSLQKYVKSGCTLKKVPLTLGLGDTGTYTFPTKKQLKAMEPDYIRLGIIYKKAVNYVAYDCINKTWSASGSQEINNWPKNDITSLIVKPKSKAITCNYYEDSNKFDAFSYGMSKKSIQKICKRYQEKRIYH